MTIRRPKPAALLALLPLFTLGACVVAPPTGPAITALPGPGIPFPQFERDDDYCRGYAASRNPAQGQEAANESNNANATAVAGTLIGAGIGAALGSLSGNVGTGAAIGAGAGLLGGASAAGGQAQDAADSLQGQYDRSYAQCMVGYGNTIETQPAPYAYAPPPPPPYFAPY